MRACRGLHNAGYLSGHRGMGAAGGARSRRHDSTGWALLRRADIAADQLPQSRRPAWATIDARAALPPTAQAPPETPEAARGRATELVHPP